MPTPVAATPPNCSSAADASVRAGSTGAILTVPAGNASSFHIAYGTNPANLDQKSEEIEVSGNESTVTLVGLTPGTIYHYQIVRTCNDGQQVSSSTSTFNTLTIIVRVIFQNEEKKPLEGITSSFTGSKETGTSDSNGLVIYRDVKPGNYQLNYSYNNKKCTTTIAVPKPVQTNPATATDQVTFEYYVVPCSELGATSCSAVKTAFGCCSWPWFILLIILGLIAFILLWLKLRQIANRLRDHDDRDSHGDNSQGDATTSGLPGAGSNIAPSSPAASVALPSASHTPSTATTSEPTIATTSKAPLPPTPPPAAASAALPTNQPQPPKLV